MAKRKRRRRRDRNFVAIPFTAAQSLGTLGDNTFLKVAVLNGNLTEDLQVISLDLTANLTGHTAGEGPINFGFAHSDYTVAELAEAVPTTSLLGPADKISQERSRRLVRQIGVFRGLNSDEGFNDGRMKRVRAGWVQQDGVDLNLWVVNRSNAALTTGSVFEAQGLVYGRWLH